MFSRWQPSWISLGIFLMTALIHVFWYQTSECCPCQAVAQTETQNNCTNSTQVEEPLLLAVANKTSAPTSSPSLSLPISSHNHGKKRGRKHNHHPSGAWNQYRLGDVIRRVPKTPGCNMFPDSIACDYLKQTDKPNDYEVLSNVVSARLASAPNVKLPKETDVLVHLRLGDALCLPARDKVCDSTWPERLQDPRRGESNEESDCWNDENDCFHSTKGALYAYPREYYENVIEELRQIMKDSIPRKLVIVYNSKHWTRNGKNKDPRHGNFFTDDLYREQFKAYLEENGFDVEFLPEDTGRLPDDDFLYMCSAKIFVQGGGGYSNLVGEVVEKMGNTVIKPKGPHTI